MPNFYQELVIITTKVRKEDFYLVNMSQIPILLKTTLVEVMFNQVLVTYKAASRP